MIGDWVPLGLYMIAMVGFVVAGLGLLGLRPLDGAISPMLVLSSGLSLVAIWRFGDATLWVGGVGDAALLVLGLWRGYGGWPVHPHHHRIWHTLALISGFAFLGYVLLATISFPWHRTWGSTGDELALSLPGDDPERVRSFGLQHAVTIDAPPRDVWPWLVQLGQDRAGFYSYDWLERTFGVDIRNANQIRPEWQHRAVGDLVRATQPSYLRGALGPDLGWTIRVLEKDRVMVLDGWGAFVLRPTGDGRTRFIIRSSLSDATCPVWAAGLQFMVFELPHFVMERRMMLGIRARAERHAPSQAANR
jgi:hypothetical protein